MANLSSTNMAFSGFGLVTGKPVMMLGWAFIYAAFTIVWGGLAVAMVGPQLAALASAQANGETQNPTAALGMLAQLGPFYLLTLLIGLAIGAVITVSAYRAILHPDQGGPLYLAFGGPELRQILLSFILFLLFMAAYIGVAIVIGIFVGIGAAAGGGNSALTGLLVFIGVIAALCGFVWFFTRMSLAGPATFAQDKLVVFGSMALTRGKFWALFGGYLLAWVFIFILGCIILAVSVGLTLGSVGFDLQAINRANAARMSSLGAMFAPMQIVAIVINSFLISGLYALFFAPAAYAYRALTDAATAFD